ncbi:hypothetical protein Tco_0647797 [Tanacetum coccineum]
MPEQDILQPTITAMKILSSGISIEEPAPTTGETSAPPAPKTAKQLAARRNQKRVKSILLLAIPDEYLLKFHNVADAKSLRAIKSKVHGAPISKEDINQKFLRSLPSSWNQIALIMRNKPDIDEIDIDDLYNNLRVYKDELKRSLGSNTASQNFAFLSSENTSSTNEVSTASGDFGVSTAGGINQVPSTPCAHDGTLLENADLEGIKEEDLMVTMAGAMHQQMNLHHRHCGAQPRLGANDWSNDFEVEPVNYAFDGNLLFKPPSCSSDIEKSDENVKSQMSARDKTGLGYSTQLNELSNNHETDSENSLSIFNVRLSDEENTPENDRFSKNGYKAVPPPITGNFLTPRADISLQPQECKEEQELSEAQLKIKLEVQRAAQSILKKIGNTISKTGKLIQEESRVSREKGKDEVVKEEEAEVPVKKTGMRRKQKARKE